MNRFHRSLRSISSDFHDSISPKHLGLGLVWAWVYCAWDTPLLFSSREGLSINSDPSWTVSATIIVATLFASAFLFRKTRPSRNTGLIALAGFFASIGTILSATVAHTESIPPLLFYAGACMTGCGCGLLYALWGDVFADLEQERVERTVPLCAAVPILFMLIAPNDGGNPVNWLFVGSLPVISAFLLHACASSDKTSRPHRANAFPKTNLSKQERAAEAGSFMLVGASITISYGVICFLSASLSKSELSSAIAVVGGFDVSTFLASIVGVAIAMACIMYSIHIDLSSAYRWTIPIVLFSMATYTIGTPAATNVSLSGQAVADVMLQIIVTVYALSIARKRGINGAAMMAAIWGCCQLGILLGNVAALAIPPVVGSEVAESPSVLLWVSVVFAVGIALLPARQWRPASYTLQHVDRNTPHCTDTEKTRSAKQATQTKTHHAAPDGENRTPANEPEDFARQRGLTARETEIFALLVKGRSAPYIRDELFLSKNTVDTHIKHIYRKLDVHSKQELIDAYESRNA